MYMQYIQYQYEESDLDTVFKNGKVKWGSGVVKWGSGVDQWGSGVVQWDSGVVQQDTLTITIGSESCAKVPKVPKVPMLHFWGAFLFQFGHHFYKKRGSYLRGL